MKIPLGRILTHHAQAMPGWRALIAGEARLSYAELDMGTNRRARMRESGVDGRRAAL